MAKVIIVGAGVNGVTAAIQLKKRGHEVILVDPGPLPHALAASTDISKAVRAAYGADEDYTVLDDGQHIGGDIIVIAVGAWTPYVLPFTKDFFRATGQLVSHIKPAEPELFAPERFPVFGADITVTGYYGFPINRDGVVKIANHGPGRETSPESPKRAVTPEDEKNLREFLSSTFPTLADAPIVYSRVCMYCDTHDGNFWIACDPDRRGLIIAAGDCGHGVKFAPVLGEIIPDAVEETPNPILEKFRWRPDVHAGSGTDVARFNPEL